MTVAPSEAAPQRATVRIASIERDSDASTLLTFDGPDAWRPAHGQYLVLERDGISRCYSLCGTPEAPLRVGVRRVEGGQFSTWALDAARIGDELSARAPRGRFTHALTPQSSREYLLVAAGAGVTPIYAVARAVLEQEPSSRVTLLCINRSLERAMLLDDVERLRNRHLDRLRLWHNLTRESVALELLSGRLDLERLRELRRRGLLPTSPNEVFLCAPAELTDVLMEFVAEAGVDGSSVHRESFGARRRPVVPSDARAGNELRVRLHGRTTVVPTRRGETVLEAVERLRPEVPSSCRAGICSTCIARLVEGEVEIAADHALSPSERAADLILTCQARPKTPSLVVDYDV
ncbi:MAG: iron-sulfur cluster-binding domain-containing protein [Acidobacteriota bacterium]